MEFLPDKCLVPELLRERNVNPVDFYTHPDINWSKQQYNAYARGRRSPPCKCLQLELFHNIRNSNIHHEIIGIIRLFSIIDPRLLD